MPRQAYDLVINGYEAGGGTIRIHDSQAQQKVFDLLGIDPPTARERFGFLLDALQFGAPPHGGIALGIDRVVMLFGGLDNIRDCIAFPKTQRAMDMMTEAPGVVDTRPIAGTGIDHRKAARMTETGAMWRRARSCPALTNGSRHEKLVLHRPDPSETESLCQIESLSRVARFLVVSRGCWFRRSLPSPPNPGQLPKLTTVIIRLRQLSREYARRAAAKIQGPCGGGEDTAAGQ